MPLAGPVRSVLTVPLPLSLPLPLSVSESLSLAVARDAAGERRGVGADLPDLSEPELFAEAGFGVS